MTYVPTPDRLEFKKLAEILTGRIDEMTFAEQLFVFQSLVIWLFDQDETSELPLPAFRTILKRIDAKHN